MPKINEDLAGALRRYTALMRKKAYFEAHEVLEEAWHPLRMRRDPRAKLAKGLINAAIAFEHLRRKRTGYVANARKTMGAYERYKGLCREGIEAFALFAEACAIVEKLKNESGFDFGGT